MPEIVTKTSDRRDTLQLLRDILKRHVFGGLNTINSTNLETHLKWMEANPHDLRVRCRLETIPELQITRVILEYDFANTPLKQHPTRQ